MTRLLYTLAMAMFIWLSYVPPAIATVNTSSVINLNTASTNVTTGAYLTLSASLPFSPSQIIVVNGSTSVIKLAYGASGSETDFVAVGGSSTTLIALTRHLSAASRLAVEAVSATASSGYISVSLLP